MCIMFVLGTRLQSLGNLNEAHLCEQSKKTVQNFEFIVCEIRNKHY